MIERLQPRFGFPFAADVVFLEEDLLWVNEPTHNTERPTDAFRALYPESQVTTLDIAPGFAIKDGNVLKANFRGPVVQADLLANCSDQIARANRYGSVTMDAVAEVAALLEHAIEVSAEYLASHDDDYRFLIRFRNSEFGILIEKRKKKVNLTTIQIEQGDLSEYDVIYTTRLHYLKRSLTDPYGDEILFVGSGGIFEYNNQIKAKQNLHRELQLLLRRREHAPKPRYGASSKHVFKAKQAVKKLIGRSDQDLYDLGAWTVFNED